MKRSAVAVGIVLLVAASVWGAEPEEPFQVGEKWVYKHDGPRPGGWRPEHIEGDRVREVISIDETGGEKCWVIKETYGAYDERPSSYYVNKENLVAKRDFGLESPLVYDPPFPFDYQILKIGEEKKYETKLTFGPNSAPFTMVSKRLADETIKVPAGEFKNCHRYQNTMKLVFSREGNEITITTRQDIWYHPEANGIVKEVFKRDPVEIGGQSRGGYTATSQLKSHTKGEKQQE